MRSIVLIADDFGLNEAVDAGILRQAEAGRLSGISCLTQPARWLRAAPQLLPLTGVQTGLHLNFSQSLGEGWFAPLPALIVRAYAHALPMAKIRQSLAEQWARFTEALGRAPDFVDGHQHVHQLPGIREALLELLAREGATPWLRVTDPLIAPGGGLKSQLIRRLGAGALRRLAVARGLRLPSAFAGVYDFSGTPDSYEQRFARWLAEVPSDPAGHTVVMCHPGMAARPSPEDPIAAARPHELAFFLSPRFAEVLLATDCTLACDLPAGGARQ